MPFIQPEDPRGHRVDASSASDRDSIIRLGMTTPRSLNPMNLQLELKGDKYESYPS
jgi:hypothetical protein